MKINKSKNRIFKKAANLEKVQYLERVGKINYAG